MRSPSVVLVPIAILAAAPAAQAAVTTYHASLSGSQESPPNKSQGKGTATILFNDASGKATWSLSYSGLSGPVIAVEISGPAPKAGGKPVKQTLPGNMASPSKGKIALNPDAASDLRAGKLFINIHTIGSKSGEIRGRFEKGAAVKAG